MCGVVGWVSYRRDLREQRDALRAMTATMACRGPDDSGTWLGSHCVLGHRRLSVIDPPGGKQPMTAHTDDGDVTLVYNGQCYNYTELRAGLRVRGHSFTTDCDTEVVLRGYLEWGTGVMDRLNGMYGFAIWDGRDERLILARDRMGIKPLYYYPTEDGVVFGSEPKAILASPLADRAIDLDGMRELFGSTKTPGAAVWHGMREVVPGTVVTVDRSGWRPSTYWTLSASRHTDDLPTTVAHVRELLEDTVGRQLVSDVPLCVLLSGGLDSSALTALAARRSGSIRSFAVDFVGQAENFVPDHVRDSPDGPYVHAVAEHTGSDHRDVMLSSKALADPAARAAAIAARELPNGLGELDNSLYLLFSAIRERSTVALSGESADEVFGGYRWFHDPEIQRTDMFPWIASAQGSFARGAMLDKSFAKSLDLEDYVRDRYREAVAEVPEIDGVSDLERRMRTICYLHLTRFMRLLLDRKDRISMAVGLEVRVPFCDHRLVDYVFNTPWSFKTFDGREKSLLRAAVADLLPEPVLKRVKAPYPSTQDFAYVTELQRQAADALRNGNEALTLFNTIALSEVTTADPRSLTPQLRVGLEKLLDTTAWFDLCRPELRM
ncbi:asparagine synthase (glutamine-hydrolyzing) [Actinoplanes sp. NPDC026623]|uniref:asparagine synthase (glutamine-hydrolyzing) n=1 Tax=Actinoplanes sp. NPDC026623 TaxID=3155610 RepID=UPI0033D23547